MIVGSKLINSATNNVTFIPQIKNDKKLAYYYSMASVTVIASEKETFSLVTAESLCCGAPVVGFKCGGAESISLGEYSVFVEYGEVNEL